jgi:DNA-binding XRE family transcriptional regulator
MATKTRSRNPIANGRQKPASRNAFQSVQVIIVGREPKLELRERLNMTRERFGRLVNVSARAIAAAELKKQDVAKLKRPYAEVARLYHVLSEVIEKEEIGPWLETPNDAFGGLKPLEVVERGEIDRLWDMAYRLQSGMPG